MSCLSCCRGYSGVDEMIINVLMVKGNAEISHVEELMWMWNYSNKGNI